MNLEDDPAALLAIESPVSVRIKSGLPRPFGEVGMQELVDSMPVTMVW